MAFFVQTVVRSSRWGWGWVALAMPVMLAAGVYEGGWSEFRRNDNGRSFHRDVAAAVLAFTMVGASAAERDPARQSGYRVSKMLVEMAMYLRQSARRPGESTRLAILTAKRRRQRERRQKIQNTTRHKGRQKATH